MKPTNRCLRPLALALAACSSGAPTPLSPLGQLDVYVNTDAPLPPAPGDALGPDDPIPLFDRVRIEVYAPSETSPCDGCTREFDVDRTLVGDGHASVGIATPVGATGYVARVRMFAASFVETGEPRADATLEVNVALPPTSTEGIAPVTVTLHTDDVAHPVGSLASPTQPDASPAQPGLAGTWPGAQRATCTAAAGKNQVCIPGGAYWMGNPLLRGNLVPGDTIVLRLVALSPFYLDETEVTVAAFRKSGLADAQDPLPNAGTQAFDCTYATTGATDTLALSCVSWSKARAYCQKLGGDLPTEAQFQYAASGLRGGLYVWGNDPPACADAVYARSVYAITPDLACPGFWVEPPGTGARDRLVMPDGVVVDLAGNLREHVVDFFQLATEPCWGTGVLQDPVCNKPSSDPSVQGQHTLMAGSWLAHGGSLAAAYRVPELPFGQAVAAGASLPGPEYVAPLGFRCARPGS